MELVTHGVIQASAREFVGIDIEIENTTDIPNFIDIHCPSIFEDGLAPS